MVIFVVDDEQLALLMLEGTIRSVQPDAEIYTFQKPSMAVNHARDVMCDIAFLDVQMRGMTGLDLAKALQDINPSTNIIFVTGFSEYMGQAFSLYASGYLLKPVTKEMVAREIENLRHPVDESINARVYVKTFGSFEVYVHGTPLVFSRAKAKEIFAILIDRQGASVTAAEIAAVLWEDREYTRSMQKQTQNMIQFMLQSLKEAGVEDIVIRRRNSLCVDKSKIRCDYYDLLNWDVRAVNRYCGEYMSNYSWAEMMTSVLDSKAAQLHHE